MNYKKFNELIIYTKDSFISYFKITRFSQFEIQQLYNIYYINIQVHLYNIGRDSKKLEEDETKVS